MNCFDFKMWNPVSDRKVNLVGTLEVKIKKFPIVFKSVRKNPKKVTEKREFLRKTCFRFFYIVLKFLRNLSKTRKFAIFLQYKSSILEKFYQIPHNCAEWIGTGLPRKMFVHYSACLNFKYLSFKKDKKYLKI
ncbi:Uncharacterized protein FWK35_00010690 [Aphis craccivora]|uniref:Uncharacterized protein n=1 Tax=Aphis craccivora TaxID=307492 RepID=A0A6G0YSF0_APHCR|nr:Uncharacterized protein FWK35_00010690 [Aphis craccivora]